MITLELTLEEAKALLDFLWNAHSGESCVMGLASFSTNGPSLAGMAFLKLKDELEQIPEE